MIAPPDTRRFRWARPQSVAGQIALLLIAAIVAAHVLAGIAFFALREPWRPETRPGVAANRLAVIARLLDTAGADERGALLEKAAQSLPSLHLKPWQGSPSTTESDPIFDHPIIERLREAFGRDLSIADLRDEGSARAEPPILRIGLHTPGGARFQASLPDDAPGPPKQGAIILTLLFLATTLTLLMMWATRALTAPLGQLAGAAEAFGTRAQPPPLPQRGPKEVLALAGALDRMRTRVARLLDDRTQMLAAISHDLRTPITRLRLRAEFIEDEQARERTLHDLDQMNALVEAALDYARGERGGDGVSTKERPLIDLGSLVQTVCDGFSDTGARVHLDEVRQVLVRADPDELERAITNLVDNAVKYAGSARLSVARISGGVAIIVDDDGPGIPEGDLEAMLQPFVRGDRARSLNETTGFGLGLTIVRKIVEGHAGRLGLENREGGGLRVQIVLPPAGATEPAATLPGPARQREPETSL